MNEVQYYEQEEQYWQGLCNSHSIKSGIDNGLKYSEEHGLDCDQMPCHKDCPLDKRVSKSRSKTKSKRHIIPYWILITVLFWATYLWVDKTFIFPAVVATLALILDVYVKSRRKFRK